ncbi:hypothetical protein ACNKHR_27390 [Shigella flexneri]
MIKDLRIAAVTVTGSVRAGAAIGAQAWSGTEKMRTGTGRLHSFIVLNDADWNWRLKRR